MEEIIFKASVNTSSAEKSINELENDIKSTSKANKEFVEQFKQIDARINSGRAIMEEFSKSIEEYKAIALNAGKETPVGQLAIKKAAELQDKLGDLGNEINRVASDGKNLQGALQIGSNILAGYGALQGAQALLGKENEELEKTFVKLQAIQSILAGIETVRLGLEKESAAMILIRSARVKTLTALEFIYAAAVGTTTGALKAARLAMLALPIVAIIAGITALVMWIVNLTQAGEDLEESNNKLTDSYNTLIKAQEREAKVAQSAYQRRIDLAKAQGKSIEEINALEVALSNDRIKRNELAIQTEKDYLLTKKEAYRLALEDEDYELAKSIREQVSASRDKYNDLKEQDKNYRNDLVIQNIEFQNKLTDDEEKANQKRLDEQKKANERINAENDKQRQLRLDREALLQDLIIANIENANERAIAQLALQQERERKSIIDKYGKNSALEKELQSKQANEMIALIDEQDKVFEEAEKAKTDKLIADKKAESDRLIEEENRSAKASLEARLLRAYDDFEAEQEVKKEIAEMELLAVLDNENATLGEIEKATAEHEARIRQLKQETADYEKNLRQQEFQNAVNITSQSLSAATDLTKAYFEFKSAGVRKGSAEELAIAKKSFEVNKKLQITQATIQGIQATLAAYSSGSAIPIVGAVTGPLFAGLAAVTAALNVGKIARTTFDGGGSASSITPVTPPTINLPTANTVLDQTQGTSTTGLTGSTTQIAIVDSDIKASLANTEKAEVTGSFG